MNKSNIANDKNKVTPMTFDDVIKLLGDCWTLRIINALQKGEMRFSEIERTIPGLNPVTLTNRLKKMEESGIVVRAIETCDKQSVSYLLTDMGHGIIPILDAIKSFAKNYCS